MREADSGKMEVDSSVLVLTQSEVQSLEDISFDYQHAWLIRIVCLFCVGVTGGIMRIKLKAIDATVVKNH